MHLHEVVTPVVEMIKDADLHCIEEVRLREDADHTGNMSRNVKCWNNLNS